MLSLQRPRTEISGVPRTGFELSPHGANGFDGLDVGSEARLTVAERESEEGFQATTVHPIGKQRPVG
jgi:hypothetical protein